MLFSRRFTGKLSRATNAASEAKRANDNTIRIVSYNILADGPKYALSSKYDYCNPKYMTSSYRFDHVIQELKHYDSDIYHLQEIQLPFANQYINQHFDDDKWFSLYTACNNLKQTLGLQLPTRELDSVGGNLMLLRKDQFEIISHSIVSYFDWNNFESPALSSLSSNQSYAIEMRNKLESLGHAAGMILIRHKSSDKLLCIVNTHLYHDPNFPHIKLLQSLVLSHGIDHFMKTSTSSTSIPLVLTGDMNSFSLKKKFLPQFDLDPPGEGGEPSGVFKFLTQGSVDPTFHEHPARRGAPSFPVFESPLGSLTSAYTSVIGREPPITTKTSEFEGNIDQIYVNNQIEVERVLAMPYNMMTDEQAQDQAVLDFGPIPNAVWPSDHIALGVDIRVN